ncbi:LodA/GoxA family CTQ-dependent oxidase [Aurantimonas sp. E1-2-R+4]|uniref:LodA/GoxA family CTQ-dependent oxidase n=1 Tax=Aurantimonas sp. E1-2-R+4 TaxID=3113714 RepID=UPI002F95B861
MAGTIVRASIRPGIGVARIGNSGQSVVSPQVTTPPRRPAGSMHDKDGALLREAAEFRIYGYDADGEVVAELTLDNADIEWSVHVASSKAAWYIFRAALDIPEAKGQKLIRRNPDYDPAKRSDLRIDPGAVAISGADKGAQPEIRCNGVFRYENTQTEVMLAQLKTDGAGRLRVLSGKGRSGAPTGLPINNGPGNEWFANSTGWYDDVADGPVEATVRIDGTDIPCEGAWVVTTPPNYASDIIGWRTIDDLLRDLYIEAGWIDNSARVSFTTHIYPLLERLSGLQWVNKGFCALFGAGGPLDFTDPTLIDKLCRVHQPGDIHVQLRRAFANTFRQMGELSAQAWPAIYGDAFGTFAPKEPNNFLSIWKTADGWLDKWVAGDFDADWDNPPPTYASIGEVPLAGQPEMLDRAAMHFCLADAFHPGCEVTWPIRHLSLFDGPYRIRRRAPGMPEPDYGDELTAERAIGPDGPLHAQGPGDLTRWMAIPWQVDTAGCRSGYLPSPDPFLPTFWPARVPNTVLTREDYDKVVDDSLPVETRRAAYHSRRTWYYPLGGASELDEMNKMVTHFARLGVIERWPGPKDGALPELPKFLYVETLPHTVAELAALAEQHGARAGFAPMTAADTQAREAGWIDEAHRNFYAHARFPQNYLADPDQG